MVVFEIVVVVVCVVSAVIAAVAFLRAARLYDQIGWLGTFSMSTEEEPGNPTRELGTRRRAPDAIVEARKARGEPPPDPYELIGELRGNTHLALSVTGTEACADGRGLCVVGNDLNPGPRRSRGGMCQAADPGGGPGTARAGRGDDATAGL